MNDEGFKIMNYANEYLFEPRKIGLNKPLWNVHMNGGQLMRFF